MKLTTFFMLLVLSLASASYGQDKKEGAKKKGAEAAQTKGKSKSSEVPANQ